MNILMFTDVYKPVINGVTFSLELMANQLRARGHHVTIVSPNYPDHYSETHNIRLPSVTFPPYPEQRLLIPYNFKKMRTLFATKWDIVHIHTLFTAGFLGIWFAKKHKIPTVFSYHTYFEKLTYCLPLGSLFIKQLATFWSKHFSNACHHLLVPSPEIREVLHAYGVKKPIDILPTAISFPVLGVEEISPYISKLNLPIDTKICLYTGRLAQEKNLLFLINAFKLIYEKLSNVHLVLIGDGPFRQRIEKHVFKLNLQHSVSFLGSIPRHELPNWYRTADVYLFPSQKETQGMTVYEAVHFGLPAVIVDGSGTRHAVLDSVNGYITPADVSIFSNKAIHLLQNPELRSEFSKNALGKQTNMEVDRFTEKLLDIYGQSNQFAKPLSCNSRVD